MPISELASWAQPAFEGCARRVSVVPSICRLGLLLLCKLAVQFVSVPSLAVCRYKHLNRIQSRIFQAAYHSNENLLVCAPTGPRPLAFEKDTNLCICACSSPSSHLSASC